MEMLAALVAAPEAGGHAIANVLLAVVAILVGTRILGELAQRLGQPSVLGELIAGVLLGKSVFGVVDPADPVIATFGELGVILLLFAIGLETQLKSLIRVGATAAVVAIAGVVLPFALGYGSAVALGLNQVPALVCGAALCATSVGISARVLSELGWLQRDEGKVVLGAAVIDDIIGLIILAVVASVVGGESLSAWSVTRIAGVAVLFVAAAVVVGSLVAGRIFRVAESARASGTLGIMGLAFAFMLAYLADLSGSAMIVGAFAAGLVLNGVPQHHEIEKTTTTIGHFFVPIFFASVGAAVDLGALADSRSLAVGGALIVCGIIGKVLAGFAPWWFKGRKLVVGVAMVPRGEVGLIFAQMGLTAGAINAGEFGALMLMVLVTTFVTPPLLAQLSAPPRRPGLAAEPRVEQGIADLVTGLRADPVPPDPPDAPGHGRSATGPPPDDVRR